GWLYGVAYRTALEARAAGARRRSRERLMRAMPEPAAPAAKPDTDLGPLLDRELSLLPERYPPPARLCELGGLARKEAARPLGRRGGTLWGRLPPAGGLWARRLPRRGVQLSAGALLGALARAAPAQVPPALARAAAGGAAPARVAALAAAILK